MATLCSEFVGNAAAFSAPRQASLVKRAHLAVVNPRGVAIEPPRTTWMTSPTVLPKVQENRFMVAPSETRSLLKKLEGKLRTAAARAAEKALHKGVAVEKEVPLLNIHRSRMANWWRDHLAIRAETTECANDCIVAARYGESDDEFDDIMPSYIGKSREAELDRSRAALREFYYPRSDPNPYK